MHICRLLVSHCALLRVKAEVESGSGMRLSAGVLVAQSDKIEQAMAKGTTV